MDHEEHIQALGEHVYVKILDPEEKTPSGLYMPSTMRGLVQRGRVVSAGRGAAPWDDEAGYGVDVGDTILFASSLKVDEKHFFVKIDDVLAVLK
jgi:chaperonin GroES